ncbi:MAG: FKBP-type peptidyl-prolyl cis-trans isomerase [Bacteroidales bacterium]|nr:FKBP-type peptidyl-prolyl cis-trans isomerase [Bacteroidales bacterium]
MRNKTILAASIVVIFAAFACTPGNKEISDVPIITEIDSVSYALGVDVGSNIKKSGFPEINPEAVAKGFADVFAEKKLLMEPMDAQVYVRAYYDGLMKMKSEKNLNESRDFLEENKGKEGVITTESGLQYKVVEQGSGPIPGLTDQVKVAYRGTLIDGREFDAADESSPVTMRVNGVIRGWTEALQMMPVGSKWILFIPPDLAYGESPRRGSIIEANHALIFEIKLIEIVPQK